MAFVRLHVKIPTSSESVRSNIRKGKTMRVEDISAHEADFNANRVDSHGKLHTLSNESIEIPGENASMHYLRVKPDSGDESYFYRSRVDKDQIVLHYTLGYLKGDIATLTQHDYHVSVPFIIGRNGGIYNLFFSGYWAYHLGPGALGGNAKRSKRTIGIELSNIGGLHRTDNGMATYYTDIYCDTNQSGYYVHQPYRRFDYYATFTDAQYDSLIILLRYLTARYGIQRKFLDKPERYETDRSVIEFGGIVSHVNYRSSGKEDIGPAFDWDRVIEGVTA